MDFGLGGKTALVLGGGAGLGKAIAKALAKEGARVAIAGRTAESLNQTVSEIHSNGGEALVLTWDVGNLSAIADQVTRIEDKLGDVDVLINNTGGPPPTPASGQDPAVWSKSFESMVLSVIAITDRVLPGMRKNKWGRIITSTSSGVVAPIPTLGISNALRLSLVGWSKTLAREFARSGITLNTVAPGPVKTPMMDAALDGGDSAEAQKILNKMIKSVPLGRIGVPEDLAGITAFLASDEASFITGQVISVSGGLTMTG